MLILEKKFPVFFEKILENLEKYIINFQVILEPERLLFFILSSIMRLCFFCPLVFFMTAIGSFAYAIKCSVVSLFRWILFKSHSQGYLLLHFYSRNLFLSVI